MIIYAERTYTHIFVRIWNAYDSIKMQAEFSWLYMPDYLLQVNVTADHRIIYGAELAAFLQTFAAIVENPDELTL